MSNYKDKMSSGMDNPAVDEILSRTISIKDCNESAAIVSNIFKNFGRPENERRIVAVDLEGTHLDKIALVQVKTLEDKIYLFRTGMNPDLFQKGRLTELFESPEVLKVMHGSFSDCQALYKTGIIISNLYDTALAHKVLQFQNEGISMSKTQFISFANMCEIYKTQTNPLKETMKEALWKRADEFATADPLAKDLTVYSAFDVEPLLDLHRITENAIGDEFKSILTDALEIDCCRPFDSDLVKFRQKLSIDMEMRDVFLQGIPKDVSKMYLYHQVCHLMKPKGGLDRILMNEAEHSAHIIAQERNVAYDLSIKLSRQPQFASAKMVQEMSPEEVKLSDEEQKKFVKGLKDKGYLLDNDKVALLMKEVIDNKCDAVTSFVIKDGNLLVELFLGQEDEAKTKIKMHLTETSLNKGRIKEFLESNGCAKIIEKTDKDVLKFLAHLKVRIKNFFDLSLGFRMVYYWIDGISFQSVDSRVPQLSMHFDSLQLPKDASKYSKLLWSYWELSNFLPPKCMELVVKRTQLEFDAAAQFAGCKEALRSFRAKYETKTVHLTGRWRPPGPNDLRNMLIHYLEQKRQKYSCVIKLSPEVWVVEMKDKRDTFGLCKTIRTEHQDPFFNGGLCWVHPVFTESKTDYPKRLPVSDINILKAKTAKQWRLISSLSDN